MITVESLISYQDYPHPLRILCLKEVFKKPYTLSCHILPAELAEFIVGAFKDYARANRLSPKQCDRFYMHLKPEYVPLSRIDFSGVPVSDPYLFQFLQKYQEQLIEINISTNDFLQESGLDKLKEILKINQEKHKTLIFGDTLKDLLEQRVIYLHGKSSIFDENLKLRKLVLHDVSPTISVDEFMANRLLSQILTPTICHSLKYLDLSKCLINKGSALMQLESLEILILYNCMMSYPDVISTICHLKNLRVLDLSRLAPDTDEELDDETEESKLLLSIVSKLPNLKHLDISGTNIIGGKHRHIPAFDMRQENPFEFLGLFHTSGDAAFKTSVPAILVVGEATESQILNACEAYIDRPDQLVKALNDLYNFYKSVGPREMVEDANRALEVLLPILTKQISDEQIIIFTTAIIWCIVKFNMAAKNFYNPNVNRKITSRLLDVMYYHVKSKVILINGGLTFLFLPDIVREYSRVATISLLMCRDQDPKTQGFGATLLNTLACQVGGEQKIYIGDLKAIETMIDIIRHKTDQNVCDEVLETAWSTLWNLTDETPINCQRFLEVNGLEAFKLCMHKFRVRNKEVTRNIMGLLGNVAECQNLRVNLFNGYYLVLFYSSLFSEIDGIECSYNACGILAHIISDGEEVWHKYADKIALSKALITRELIIGGMKHAIKNWPINSRRNINYRSFQPIVKLLDPNIAPASQYWAVFALTNLTRINPAKYCPMLVPYDGLIGLRRLTEPGVTKPYVTNLAKIAIYQYERFEQERTLAGLEQCDSIDLEVIKNFRAESINLDGTSEMGDLSA